MNKSMFVVLVVVVVIVIVFINTPSGHERELERYRMREEIYSDSINDLRVQFQKIIEHDRIISAKYEHDSIELVEAKRTAEAWRKKYNHEKNNNRHFSNAAIDSLLAEVR